MSASRRLRVFFEQRVGEVVTAKELQAAAGNVSEWARRVRELRDEHGLQILTHNDREDLSPGQYILVSLEARVVIARGMSSKLRTQILWSSPRFDATRAARNSGHQRPALL
jgi:hypothetical protein